MDKPNKNNEKEKSNKKMKGAKKNEKQVEVHNKWCGKQMGKFENFGIYLNSFFVQIKINFKFISLI